MGRPVLHLLDDAAIARFWAKADALGPNECWPWTGKRKHNGYGAFTIMQRIYVASRISLSLKLGREITEGSYACHSCDNPVCVNPSHLFEGTPKENQQDCVAKSRKHRWRGSRSGENNPGAKLKLSDVEQIRALRRVVPELKIAEQFGISPSAVRCIMSGVTWNHG